MATSPNADIKQEPADLKPNVAPTTATTTTAATAAANVPVKQERKLANIGSLSERGEKAMGKLNENRYDLESWNYLIKESQLKRVEEARNLYELLIDHFPLTGRFWKIYIEHEIKAKNFDKVEKLFQRSLTKVLHVDLWKCYLAYIKETKCNQSNFREKMAKAYDFALDKIGADYMSYSMWNDYVTFMKNVDVVGSYAENQKITNVRRIFQRGVVNPMVNIEAFWKDYIEYERSINPIIADKMVNDRSREYMTARRVAKEYEAATRGLNRNAPALPPSSDPEQVRQVELWRKYIAWEKSNPMRSEDGAEVVKRVEFAYEQCLLCLGHYPDVWIEYANYLEDAAKKLAEKSGSQKYLDDAAAVYQRATTSLLKTNVLVHFAWADFEEGRNRKEKATEIYDELLKQELSTPDATLVYVQYMKFSRRAEGIKVARQVFKRAREDPRCGHQVFCAAALMEYYCSKDKNVACKIFELGLKKYPSEQAYILAYLNFLSHLNEENNTRVLFERVLTSGAVTPEDSIDIWNKFLEFESNIGDLASITKVERRRATALEKVAQPGSDTKWLVDRYKFLDLYPCSAHELRAIGYNVPSQTTLGRVEDEPVKAAARPRPNLNQMLPFKPVKDTKIRKLIASQG